MMLGAPLLMLMSDSDCKFIQMNHVQSISNEILVQKPCQFKLNFKDYSYSFACYSSTDYTSWIDSLLNCQNEGSAFFGVSSLSDQDDDKSLEEKMEIVRISSHLSFAS